MAFKLGGGGVLFECVAIGFVRIEGGGDQVLVKIWGSESVKGVEGAGESGRVAGFGA